MNDRILWGQITVIFLIVLGAVWTATQWTAWELGYQAALGDPWFRISGYPVYPPPAFFWWWFAFDAYAPPVFYRGAAIAASGGFLSIIVAIFMSIWRARERRRAETYGSARWASPREVRAAGMLGEDGVIIGRLGKSYLRHDGAEHLLCFAPTRSGKGVGLVIPTLLTWPGSCIVHDIKGENWELTAGFRARHGRVLLFDPTNRASAAYNPLFEVRRGEWEVRDVQNVADVLVDPEGSLEKRNHWEKTSHALLVGAILHVLYAEEAKTLAGVAAFLSDPRRPIESTLRRMKTTKHLGTSVHPVVAAAAQELLNIIDNFLSVFSTYIDSGFGLLGGEVGFLSSTLIVIDVTIAALFWAWGTDEDVLQRLVKKTLYIGVFAFIIGNFQALSVILLESFAGLGLKASGGAMTIGDFMRPGMIAATGLDAAEPLLDATADLVGPVGLFTNFVQILILLIAWVIVVLAFFILAVQVFVTILEFKLVTLAGFVLLPFAFFNRTAFMAERVLGHVISSGIKLLVLAVITGIGVTLFERFMEAGLGTEPDIREVMAIALGALTLLGLGIFGPSVANGIVAGGPQLGAGAAAGTTLAAGATIAAGAAGATLATGAAASMAGKGAAGASRAAGSASASYARGAAGKSGMRAFGSGMANLARDAASGAGSPLRQAAARLRQNFAEGQAGKDAPASARAEPLGQPAWAAAMKRRQAITSGATIGAQTLKQGDSHGAGSSPDISQKD